MIWFPPDDAKRKQNYCTAIVSAMRRFQKRLAEIVPRLEIEWQIDRLPHPARFGIAAGLVYPLKPNSFAPELADPIDYAGYCINLAVRLQDHCPEVGFIIHELVFPKLEGLVKYIAHGMKGDRSVPVLIFASDFPALSIDHVNSKFLPCGHESELRCQATQREFGMGNGTPVIGQPRFQAQFVGGPWNGATMFLPESRPFFSPVDETKDTHGKVIGHRRLDCRQEQGGARRHAAGAGSGSGYLALLDSMNQAALRAARRVELSEDPRVVAQYARVLVSARQEANHALRAATTREKFEFDAATACLIHQVKVQSIASDESLDDGQRIMKIREELFGPDLPK